MLDVVGDKKQLKARAGQDIRMSPVTETIPLLASSKALSIVFDRATSQPTQIPDEVLKILLLKTMILLSLTPAECWMPAWIGGMKLSASTTVTMPLIGCTSSSAATMRGELDCLRRYRVQEQEEIHWRADIADPNRLPALVN